MWRRLRSSPSMVVAVVSLVVALLCVLYVVERPGTIAIGSPAGSPAGGIRVIDAYGYTDIGSHDLSDRQGCRAVKVWDHVDVTVPEGKQWMVVVTPATWNPSWGSLSSPDVMSSGYYFEYKGSERRAVPNYLPSGTYDEVDLYIFNCRYDERIGWWWAGTFYLVVELDEYYEVGQ